MRLSTWLNIVATFIVSVADHGLADWWRHSGSRTRLNAVRFSKGCLTVLPCASA